jgi:hypothetical protein
MGLTAGLDGWVPIRVHDREAPSVEWCWLDGIAFDEPFFVETVERAFRTPFSLLFRQETPIEALSDLEPGLAPSGLVLHGSRSGSTLVARMLGSVPCHLVLSEPPPVDQVLRLPARDDDRVRWLRDVVSVLGRPRAGQRGYVLKLDAWSTRSLGTLRSAFPGVPWVFLFREPVDVLASHLRRRGAHMVPGALDPALFGFEPREVERIPPEEYCARVLASIYRAALEHRDEAALFIDYSELPDAVADRILPAFGLECDEDELARMRQAAGLDAKNPTLTFAREELPATPELREAADRWVRPVYEELLAC